MRMSQQVTPELMELARERYPNLTAKELGWLIRDGAITIENAPPTSIALSGESRAVLLERGRQLWPSLTESEIANLIEDGALSEAAQKPALVDNDPDIQEGRQRWPGLSDEEIRGLILDGALTPGAANRARVRAIQVRKARRAPQGRPRKTLVEAEREARRIVNSWAAGATAVSWVPGSSYVLSGVDLAMVSAVAEAFEVEGNQAAQLGNVAASHGAKWLVESLSFVPGPGWVLKAIIAGGVTKALGETVIAFFKAESQLR